MKFIYSHCLPLFLCFNLFIQTCNAALIDTVEVVSPSMSKSIPVLVVLPDSHAVSSKKFPVLYLLHGHSGNFRGWLEIAGNLKSWSDKYQMIIVCPDGDLDSWYLNSPVQKNRKYETFISSELINYIDSKYHSLRDKDSRGISGVSMGGHGAMSLSLKHPDVFGLVGSSSGVLDLMTFSGFWNLQTLLGQLPANKELWKKYSSSQLLDQIKTTNQKFWIDCGTEDFLIDVNRKFHQKLLDKNINHVYLESPGSHNVKYWKESYARQIHFFDEKFKK